MMRYSGLVLQIVAVLTVILGVLAGIAQMVSDTYASTGGIILVSTVIGGTLLFGIGSVFRTLADIAVDVRRSAEANECTAEASARRAEALDRLAPPQYWDGNANAPGCSTARATAEARRKVTAAEALI